MIFIGALAGLSLIFLFWLSSYVDIIDLTRRTIISRIDYLDNRIRKIEKRCLIINGTFGGNEMVTRVVDEDFAIWAFGDIWESFLSYYSRPIDLMEAWNELHGDLHYVNSTDIISESIEIMQEIYYNQTECGMDKKMHKITQSIKVAEKDIKKGKPKAAVNVLKGAEKKNEKLVKIDKNVRDPIIDKTKKLCKAVDKTKGK